jgi:5-methylcytosine-specific restriction endonuclease McrA
LKLAEHGRACAYCGSPGKLTVDHLVALKSGGSNSIENLVPACKSCNSSKGTAPVAAWLAGRIRRGHKVTPWALDLLAHALLCD